MRFLFCLFFVVNVSSLGAIENRLVKYEGVDYLMVLSNKWIIAAVKNSDEIQAKLTDLTSGDYNQQKEVWEEGKKSLEAFNTLKSFHKKFFATCRLTSEERELDYYDYYTLSSQDDSDYGEKGEPPLRVTRQILSIGACKNPALGPVDFAHFCYLELPSPLKTGCTYKLSLKSGKKVTFLFDEKDTVSRAIKINQAGYDRLNKHKYAYFGGYLQEFGPLEPPENLAFKVFDAKSDKEVFEGKLKRRDLTSKGKKAEESQTGEEVFEADLGPFTLEGEYYLAIPGVGRSWTFRNTLDPYGEVFFQSARALFFNRSGQASQTPWGEKELAPIALLDCDHIPFFATAARPRDYRGSDVIGYTAKMVKKLKNLKGGWDDLRGERHLSQFTVIFDLLTAYEEKPSHFTDGQLALPESGNGIPDILDEVEWGLSVWKETLDENGGVVGAIVPLSPPIKGKEVALALSKKTRWASLLFSSACSQYSQLVRSFSKEKADTYLDLAKKSFEFGSDAKNSLGEISIPAATKGGAGVPYIIRWQEKEKMLAPYLLHAKVRLFASTGEVRYLEDLETFAREAPRPFAWPFSLKDFSPWIYYSAIKYGKEALTSETLQKLKRGIAEKGEELLVFSNDQAYRESWPVDGVAYGGWGEACMANPARALIAAYLVTNDTKFLNGAARNLDFMLGANPMGMCWTTGVGSLYPTDIEPPYQFEAATKDPLPGLTVYGPTGDMFFALKNEVWSVTTPEGTKETFVNSVNRKIPFWRTWSCHPRLNTAQCGYSPSETLSPMLFCAAFLMKERWHPTPRLLKAQPKSAPALYGRWFTP